MHKKDLLHFLKRWVQFRVGAIPRLPKCYNHKMQIYLIRNLWQFSIYWIRTGKYFKQKVFKMAQ